MSTPQPMTHPSDETVAAFIDGTLDGEQRQSVLDHTTECADCYSLTGAVWDYNAENPVAEVARPRFGRRLAIAAASLATAAGLVVVFSAPIRDRQARKELSAASAKLQYRPVEARLSEDFPYKPPPPVMRSANQERLGSEELHVMAAAAKIIERNRDQVSARARHLVGIAQLFAGDDDAAIEALRAALMQSSNVADIDTAIRRSTDASLLNDVAAAHHARGSKRSRRDDLVIARVAAERAWTLDRTPVAGWNRALALDALGETSAQRAWQDYVDIDPRSLWSDEARRRLERFQSQD